MNTAFAWIMNHAAKLGPKGIPNRRPKGLPKKVVDWDLALQGITVQNHDEDTGNYHPGVVIGTPYDDSKPSPGLVLAVVYMDLDFQFYPLDGCKEILADSGFEVEDVQKSVPGKPAQDWVELVTDVEGHTTYTPVNCTSRTSKEAFCPLDLPYPKGLTCMLSLLLHAC